MVQGDVDAEGVAAEEGVLDVHVDVVAGDGPVRCSHQQRFSHLAPTLLRFVYIYAFVFF